MKRGALSEEAILLIRAWLAAFFQIILLCGLAVILLGRPWFFESYYHRMMPKADNTDAQKIVNWLSSNDPTTAMNIRLRHGQLGPKELNHFADVRRFFGKFPLVCAACLALWLGTIQNQWHRNFILRMQVRALMVCAILILAATGLALWDWRIFFAWVHYPFFGETSWRFPRESYSLRLFPAEFWKLAGLVVVLTPIAVSTGVILFLRKPRVHDPDSSYAPRSRMKLAP